MVVFAFCVLRKKKIFKDGTNAEKFCGSDNWRMPTIEELYSIADYQLQNQLLMVIISQILLPVVFGHPRLILKMIPMHG